MNGIINAIILSILPISELRGGIPVAIASGIPVYVAFLICTAVNILAIPITYFFLDYIHRYLMKYKRYNNFFEKKLENARRKIEKNIGNFGEFIALMIFVGIPLPMTGAYTGTLLAWFFGINRKKAYLSIGLGVLIAGLIVSLVVGFGVEALKFFVK